MMMKTPTLFLVSGCLMTAIMILFSALCACAKRLKSTGTREYSESFSSMPEEHTCKRISLKDIYSATDNLSQSNFIGQGITGKVYKGVLSDGWNVAIKHFNKGPDLETFMQEVTSLSHVRHPNLVKLRGYCMKEDESFLVYELCDHGSLSEWLFGENKLLNWVQRLEIAVGCARCIWFLHTYPGGCIVHRDIKPTNILIGKDFEAKLSDFGLSKVMDYGVSYVSSEVRGTFGYVDPEYRQDRHVRAAGDVYSFGIVLLQILSGKKAVILGDGNDSEPMPLHKMAKLGFRSGNVSELADPRLSGDYSKEAFGAVLKLALSCVANKRRRPSMEQIVKKLEAALLLSKREKSPIRLFGTAITLHHAITIAE